jgi:dUTPase
MFKVLDECCTPKRGTKYSAYVDLFSREDVVIGAGETKIVKLGVKLDLEKLKEIIDNKTLDEYEYLQHGTDLQKDSALSFFFKKFLHEHYLEVALRSSLSVKGLIIANGIGVIDLDYTDEIGLIVHYPINKRMSEFNIKKGDKVAQCTLKEHKGFLMGYESDVIRDGGFGSTGA